MSELPIDSVPPDADEPAATVQAAGTGAVPTNDEVLAELERLERASTDREAALLALTDEVPGAVSRTAVLRSMLSDLGGLLPRRRT